jgi:uncharacterized protein YydD (DUF2326 family)
MDKTEHIAARNKEILEESNQRRENNEINRLKSRITSLNIEIIELRDKEKESLQPLKYQGPIVEDLMILMQKYNVPYFEHSGIKIQMNLPGPTATMQGEEPGSIITNEQILNNPYHGLDEVT